MDAALLWHHGLRPVTLVHAALCRGVVQRKERLGIQTGRQSPPHT